MLFRNVIQISKIAGYKWRTEKGLCRDSEETKGSVSSFTEVYNQKKEEEDEINRLEENEDTKIHKHEAVEQLKKSDKTGNIIKKTTEVKQV